MIKGLSEHTKYLESVTKDGLGGLAGVTEPPPPIPLRPPTALHQRRRAELLSAFETIYRRPHPSAACRLEEDLGEMIDDAIGADGLDAG